jgi:hypothetical protein
MLRLVHDKYARSVPGRAGAYIETKHPTWHDSFKLPALKGKSMTRKYIEVSCCCQWAGSSTMMCHDAQA